MLPSPPNPVVAIGAIHLDTIAHAAESIRPETSTPARFSSKPGGVATNIARALVRLGVDTRLVGALGDDSAAEVLVQHLSEEGIRLSHVRRLGYATGQYLALHDPDGTLTAACVDDRVLSEAPADIFDNVLATLRAQLPPEAIWFLDANLPERMLVGIAAKKGTGLLVANAVSDAKAPRLRSLLPRLDCLMLNRGEAAALTGLSREASLQDLAHALAATGLASFVLTGGAEDVHVWNAGSLSTLPTPPTDIVDVTGAGDALAAGTLAAMARGHTLTDAVPFGLAAAGLTLRATGALAETLSWDTLDIN